MWSYYTYGTQEIRLEVGFVWQFLNLPYKLKPASQGDRSSAFSAFPYVEYITLSEVCSSFW
jgi:hypothetical protein